MGAVRLGYALVWFLVTDRVKLVAYRILDPIAVPLLVRKPIDVVPRIARRAYQIYERQGRRDGGDVRDWLQAEREIRDEPRE